MPNILLKSLAKCSESYFQLNYTKVLECQISLQELTEEYKLVGEINKVYKVLAVISNYQSIHALKEQYPGKFEASSMKRFIGAVFSKEEVNIQALDLKNYYTSVVSDISEVDECPVLFISIKSVDEILGEDKVLNDFEMIVFNMKSMDSEKCKTFIQLIMGSNKPLHAALLLFPREVDYFEVVAYMRMQLTSMIKDFQLVPLLFKSEVTVSGSVGENVKYALLFGKFHVSKGPLLVCYEDVAQISKVLDSVCPLRSKVAMVNESGVKCIKVHDENLHYKVHYYGTSDDLTKFRRRLISDKSFTLSKSVNEENGESNSVNEENGENNPTTSPIKSVPTNNDSGFVEDEKHTLSTVKPTFNEQMSAIQDMID